MILYKFKDIDRTGLPQFGLDQHRDLKHVSALIFRPLVSYRRSLTLFIGQPDYPSSLDTGLSIEDYEWISETDQLSLLAIAAQIAGLERYGYILGTRLFHFERKILSAHEIIEMRHQLSMLCRERCPNAADLMSTYDAIMEKHPNANAA